jgi:hypothetical protein
MWPQARPLMREVLNALDWLEPSMNAIKHRFFDAPSNGLNSA